MLYLKECNKKVLDKLRDTVYNKNVLEFDLCIESKPIGNYEPCQVRKEAAINSKFLCGVLSIERLNFIL